MLVTLVLGSIHAFSIFISPLEASFSASRGSVSLIYSLALVSLTLLVLCGYRVYHRTTPAWIVFGACAIAAAGITIAGLASELWQVFIGYSLIYGAANGLGYGFVLQLASRAMPKNKGFAMGAVTAAYAIGATLFARVLAEYISPQTPVRAFWILAGTILITGCVAAMMLRSTGIRFHSGDHGAATGAGARSDVVFFWLAYGLSVFAGLMAIGHAAGIVQSGENALSESAEFAIWGAVLIGAGNAVGGFVGGVLSDRISIRMLLTTLPVMSAICLFTISLTDSALYSATLLSVVGLSYGAIIAVYPHAINLQFGELNGPKVYGRVFTAWGFSGLVGPWLAGALFDHTGGYSLPLICAAATAVLSAIAVTFSSLGRPTRP